MNPIIFETPDALARAAALSFQELAQEAIEVRGRFNVALAGGSTPKVIYEQLAALPLPWAQIHLYWGDERLVPITDPRSNYQMVSQALLGKISISPENVHRVEVILELSPEQTFQVVMSNYFLSQEDHAGLPYGEPHIDLHLTNADFEKILKSYITELENVQFDLVHLGLGTDGHMASLFPASDLETTQSAQLTFPTAGLEPQVQRISLSLQTINAARVKQFFVTGSSKKSILEQIRHGADYPATRVTNAQWWLDKAAS